MFSFIDRYDIFNLITSRTPISFSRLLTLKFKEEKIPITKEQFSILVLLWKEEGCSQQYLAEQTFRDKPGITRLLDLLEKEEIAYRKSDPNDRRSNLIYLTEKGKKLESRVTEVVQEVILDATRNVSKEDAEKLKEILEKIFNNIQEASLKYI